MESEKNKKKTKVISFVEKDSESEESDSSDEEVLDREAVRKSLKSVYVPGSVSAFLAGKSNDEEDDEDDKEMDISSEQENKSDDSSESSDSDNETEEVKSDVPGHNESKPYRTIFVGNVPVNTPLSKIRRLFQKSCGPVESIRCRSVAPLTPNLSHVHAYHSGKLNPNKANYNAYIVFKNQSSVEDALKLNNITFEFHHLRVDTVIHKRLKTRNKYSVFIGNLPYNCREEWIREHFKDCGEIDNVRLIRHGKTGMGKGIGYVTFKEKSSIQQAVKLHDTTFRNRYIRVQKWLNPEQHQHIAKKEAKRLKVLIKREKEKALREGVDGRGKMIANRFVGKGGRINKQALLNKAKAKAKVSKNKPKILPTNIKTRHFAEMKSKKHGKNNKKKGKKEKKT